MRPSTLAAAAALTLTFGFAGSAFAQDNGGWFDPEPSDSRPPTEEVDNDGPEEEVEPVEEVVVKKRRKRRVIVVDGNERSPEWTRGRRGRQKRVITAREGEDPPPGYRLGYRSRRNLWIPGVTLLAGGYVATALTSLVGWSAESSSCYSFYSDYSCESHEWGWGFLPLAGPWFITADSSFDGGWRVAYGIMGVAQDLGLILTIAGAASKRPVWIHSPNRAEAAPALMPQVSVGPASASMSMAF